MTPRPAERPDPAARRRFGGRALRYLLLLLGSVLLLDAIIGERGLLAVLNARREYQALEQALERARAENADLRDQIRHLRSDPATIEAIARGELGFIKPGEKLFIIRDAAPPTP
ncbi:MAG: septum formation initiator family protein [Acidimicrobiia bacterium]|nr:septum formation initiator family protein [Acidimicrobiia bacterium]